MVRLWRVTAVVVVVVTLYGCNEDRRPTAPTMTPPVVRGTVLNYQTQAPMPGAVVRIITELHASGAEAVTDALGRYSLPQPQHTGRPYYFVVNDWPAGRGYPVGANYRGDLLADAGPCVTRYGLVIDAQTFRAIEGASVVSSGNTATTTSIDGWYRIDWGCPSSGTIGFNTSFLTASHSSYTSQQQVLGRGIQSVQRLDFILQGR